MNIKKTYVEDAFDTTCLIGCKLLHTENVTDRTGTEAVRMYFYNEEMDTMYNAYVYEDGMRIEKGGNE